MTDMIHKDISASSLGDAFKQCILHMKAGFPVWEDFLVRGHKLHRQLENTVSQFNSFMEGLNRVADIASRGRAGGTSDIGAGLSNLVSWHRTQEFKIKEMNTALSSKLLTPLQAKMEDWKKITSHMEREHDKEVQRLVKDVKDSTKTAQKTQKHLEAKLKKDKSDKISILQRQLDQQKKEVSRLVHEAEERERSKLNMVMLEERRWYSGFVAGFSKSLDVEVSMFSDVDRLKSILSELGETISQPNTLPVTTTEFIENWNIPSSASPHISRRRPSLHNSSASLTSSHSRSSLDSQESINITAPIPPPAPPFQTPPTSSTGSAPPPSSSMISVQAVPPPVPPITHQAHPLEYQQNVGRQYPQGNSSQYQGNSTQYPPQQSQEYPPQYNQGPPNLLQYPPQQSKGPPNSMQHPPQYNQRSQYQQSQGPPNSSQLPPPPPLNFPATPDTCYDSISNRPLPPVPGNVAYDENFEPISTSISVSSLSSHHSTESSRSLSPPVGPARSPNQTRAQLTSLQEETPDLQTSLLNKIKQRSVSCDNTNHTSNQSHQPSEPHPPSLPRTTSLSSRVTTAPPVSYKPPRIPNKPSRTSSLRISSSSGQSASPLLIQQPHNHTSNATPTYSSAPPHHVLNPITTSSDSDEDESAFAKALREKRLKKTNSSNTLPRGY